MIFSRSKDKNYERLQNVLISDKQFSPQQVEKVLKSDVYNLLSSYCSLSPADVSVSVELQKNGRYAFNIYVESDRLKIFGSLPDNY